MTNYGGDISPGTLDLFNNGIDLPDLENNDMMGMDTSPLPGLEFLDST